MPPTLTPQVFAAKWRGDTRKERSVSQEHFIDLCRLLDHPTPGDSRDGSLAFEEGASKQRGGQGWADVWKKGYFAWEYKGPHADLDKAYGQLLQYRESLENPPLLVVSDIQQIVIHTNFTNTVKQTTTLTLDDLLTSAGQRRLRDLFYDPNAFKVAKTTEDVTKEAAAEFAKLATQLRKWGEEPHRVAHFLIRLLFCLFAEDIGLLPGGLFSRLLERARTRPTAFAAQLRQLFDVMAHGGWFGADEILHFNGRLFDDADVLELDSDGLGILAKVSTLDWSSIEPSILGTLFERSLDPAKRSQFGMHYTGRDDILLIVEPVLMAPLRRRWAEVQTQAGDLAVRRDAASAGQRTRLQGELQGLLVGFAQEIASVRVLDPACGSGNFLYVALKQLLDLEKEVNTFAADIGAGAFFPQVGPEQLRGIEINEYAHELAQTTVWIGYIQWLRDNGYGQPSQPILKPLDTIKRMDAILAFDEQGQPVEPVWPEADVIIGNPPFLGVSRMRLELGDIYVEQIRDVYEGRVPGGAELVTYWFDKAHVLIEKGAAKRAGLLATQAIRMGANRRVLERIKQTGSIFLGWRDREWILDGAAVRISMIGFDDGRESERTLDGVSVQDINADLTSALNITVAKRLSENKSMCFMGSSPKGPLDIDEVTALSMIRTVLNTNGRPNTDVVRPVYSGIDIVQRPRQKWTIDFGLLPLSEAAEYEAPFEYVKKVVYPIKSQNRRAAYAEKWWQYAEPRPGMRKALHGLFRFIATPSVSKHRVFAWINPVVLCNQKVIVFARDDNYFFGMLHSRAHEVWSLATASRHGVGNDPTYNNTTCFETFPFPWPPGREPKDDPRVAAIAAAARDLVEKRDRWLNPEGASEADLKKRTLTNLYNERPTWLRLAHEKLDKAVLDAYGWPHDTSDEDILARLLTLNLERAAAQGSAAPVSASDEDDV
jgi:hypothetical protein